METERENPQECYLLEMETEREEEDWQEMSSWWSELPIDLKEKTLAWLPTEKLFRYCSVSKEWDALLSSTMFISNDWAVAPPNRKSWLVLFHQMNSPLSCMAYCFFTNTWKRLPLTLLPVAFQHDEKYRVYWKTVEASGAGLFGTTIAYSHSDRASRMELTLTVSNSLTRKSLEIPKMDNNYFIWGINIIAEEGLCDNGETYKVIAIAEKFRPQKPLTVEIYDSSLKSWSTAGQLPQNLKPISKQSKMFVVSEDFLYFYGTELNSLRSGIVIFGFQNGDSIFVPWPLEHVECRCHCLLTCGTRVLLAMCMADFSDIIIWEIEKPKFHSDSLMVTDITEIARMPQTILEEFKKKDANFGFGVKFDFEGLSDLVCIRYGSGRGNEVLIYSLSKNIWRWLPVCPIQGADFQSPMFRFQPSPHSKV